MKNYATMTASGAIVVTAKSKKEAAEKLQVSIKNVYLY
jgi:transposase